MMDFPLTALLDERICTLWREAPPAPARRELSALRQHKAPTIPRARVLSSLPLTGTVFEKTRQRPATRVLRRRGMAKSEPTARLARELRLSRKPLHALRQRSQAHLHASAPAGVITGTAAEADDLYQNAGKKALRLLTPATGP